MLWLESTAQKNMTPTFHHDIKAGAEDEDIR